MYFLFSENFRKKLNTIFLNNYWNFEMETYKTKTKIVAYVVAHFAFVAAVLVPVLGAINGGRLEGKSYLDYYVFLLIFFLFCI